MFQQQAKLSYIYSPTDLHYKKQKKKKKKKRKKTNKKATGSKPEWQEPIN